MKSFVVGTSLARALGLVAIVCLLLPASRASAHAEPERANPPINGRVATAPATLEIWFSEEVSTSDLSVTVKAPDGSNADLGDAAVDLFDANRVHVTVSLRPGLPTGNYVVQWHTVSAADGDAADGFFSFFIETGSASGSPVASPVAAATSGTPQASPVASSASPVASAASPVAQPTVVATVPSSATTAVPTPGAIPVTAAGEDDFDSRAFGIAVLVGIVVAVALFFFWRLVRPGPGERQPPS